jgi:uroporphyrinogen decarboxylase
MGFENFCLLLYDDRDLIEEIMETRTNLALAVLSRMFDEVCFDIMHFWEDIAFNGGPILSPEIFRELAVPRYRRLTDLFRSKGGTIVSVDSDGDIHKLIPGWLEGGVNAFWPLEVNAGMDVVALRARYGKSFSLRGGINKYALLEGRDAIDRELERVAPVAEDGAYLPTLDHHVPRGVTFENYAYYMEQKKKVLGVT